METNFKNPATQSAICPFCEQKTPIKSGVLIKHEDSTDAYCQGSGRNPTSGNPPPNQERLRIKKKLRFAVKEAEYLESHISVFKNYIQNDLQHDNHETVLLLRIFRALITEKNIRAYISVSAQTIYYGLTHQCLSKFAQPIRKQAK